jgi:hypothetical protein
MKADLIEKNFEPFNLLQFGGNPSGRWVECKRCALRLGYWPRIGSTGEFRHNMPRILLQRALDQVALLDPAAVDGKIVKAMILLVSADIKLERAKGRGTGYPQPTPTPAAAAAVPRHRSRHAAAAAAATTTAAASAASRTDVSETFSESDWSDTTEEEEIPVPSPPPPPTPPPAPTPRRSGKLTKSRQQSTGPASSSTGQAASSSRPPSTSRPTSANRTARSLSKPRRRKPEFHKLTDNEEDPLLDPDPDMHIL